jgi:predicted DNA-binding transcriptional regulator YafY
MSGLRTTTAIVEAIGTRHLLAFDYHGKTRIVEPHTFGLDRWARSLLCAWQVECDGEERSGWRFFFVEQMANAHLDARRFVAPRAEYRRGDGAFKSITTEL